MIELTALEYKLLITFVRNLGTVLSRERLLSIVWGREINISERVVDTHVATLRKKIEQEPSTPRHLVSVRGLGYRFDA